MLWVLSQAEQKPQTLSLKNALKLIWSALQEKAIDNYERLAEATAGMCVSQR